ncbi:MAG TPA: Clp1/GlmU family protein [Candidatus Binatia bacterium]|nr:Clp1/GlmU family protein [Candidatus Binatia bacterium]
MAATIAPGPGWDAVRERLAGDTVMVIGAADRGKSHFARWLVAGSPQPAALLSADVGQPSLGPPACLAVAPRRPWRAPDRLWFVGDVTPVRHLLAIVTGAARLAARARSVGAARIVIDSSGLVDGPLGRVLKYHKAIAAGVTDVVAIECDGELAPLVVLLETIARVHRVTPADVARERDRDERRRYRERRFRTEARGAEVLRFDSRGVVGTTWDVGTSAPLPDTLVGLLDRDGLCVRLGVVHAVRDRVLEVRARRPPPRTVAWLRLGTLRVTARGEEMRR